MIFSWTLEDHMKHLFQILSHRLVHDLVMINLERDDPEFFLVDIGSWRKTISVVRLKPHHRSLLPHLPTRQAMTVLQPQPHLQQPLGLGLGVMWRPQHRR
jgi:hypothetical protein